MMSALVIPYHVRSDWDVRCLHRLLKSVSEQTTPFAHVYVVDDASPLQHSLAGYNIEHIVMPTNGGPARARNAALTRALAAGHEQVFFTDHDCILDRDWHGHMARFLSGTDFAAVGG